MKVDRTETGVRNWIVLLLRSCSDVVTLCNSLRNTLSTTNMRHSKYLIGIFSGRTVLITHSNAIETINKLTGRNHQLTLGDTSK